MHMRTLRELLTNRKGSASINAFSEQVGLPVATLHLFLSGNRDAGIGTLRRIASAFPNDNEIRDAINAYIFGDEPVKETT